MEDESSRITSDVNTKEQRGTSPEDPYESMCISLYAYRYGAIGFLELIAKFEEELGLVPAQNKLPPMSKC